MTLHCSRLESVKTPSDAPEAPESRQSSLDRMRQISTSFNAKIGQVDFEAISPFPPHSLVKAASIRYQMWRDKGDITSLDAADSLIQMLKHFSRRWMNAGNEESIIDIEVQS
jgi:hypothetical protein